MMQTHIPVLLEESLAALKIEADGTYVDGTFGRGGHSAAILSQLGPNGKLIAIDKDSEAIAHANLHFADEPRFSIAQGSFAELTEILSKHDCVGKVNGILVDLGVSSPQLDDADRGFSFLKPGPLDMRMDQTRGYTAEQWIRTVDETEMVQTFKEYGEERFAKRIARAICEARKETEINDTLQLAEMIAKAHPKWEKHKHPATRVFQAIRIRVNRELEDLQTFLSQALDCLAEGGRLVVISFHSLEDRIVKQFIQTNATVDEGPIDLPIATSHMQARLKKIGKMQMPGESENSDNPRARSARMRVAEKLK